MTETNDDREIWASGQAYEAYVGRWSRPVAREFLSWIRVPARRDWLDVGCGTGALSRTILETTEPGSVTGIDQSAGFIDYARGTNDDARLRFDVGNAMSLPVEDSSIDAAVSALVLNFVPDPGRMVAEMMRTVKPGGVVAAYVWDYAGRMEMMRYFWESAGVLDPPAGELDEGLRFPICRPAALESLFYQARLKDVASRAIDVATDFTDFDDFWSPFLGGQGPAPAYAMSLSGKKRGELRERIRAGLPTARDGSISLLARAWAVKGTK